MDQELTTYLDGRFGSLAKLVEEHSDSLQREMAGLQRELAGDMATGFDRLEAATTRNTKVLVGGSKAVAALTQWAQKRDQLDRKPDQEIRDLRLRMQKLERQPKRRAS